jgi:cell wall-associated NlpC family hydrolase
VQQISFFNLVLYISILITCVGCVNNENVKIENQANDKTIIIDTALIIDSAKKDTVTPKIETLPILQNQTDSIITFAKTLIGIPYTYASANPVVGFDCSGFITYVYNHFNIKVPRSSIDFTNYGKEVAIKNAVWGNLILFTGTDSTSKVVGHMGIITENSNGQIKFIHSTSGKANGVTITPLNEYYKERFVKIIALP